MILLLVDDHAVVRTGIRDIVSVAEPEAEFEEAASAHEALNLIENRYYDIIILDLSLPDESGLALLQRIRAIKPAQPVLVLSMHPEEAYASRALQAGANGYLCKASAPGELVNAINAVLDGGVYIGAAQMTGLNCSPAPSYGSNRQPPLSQRELHVLRLMAKGLKLTDIADELQVSPKTVSTYKSRIMRKFDLENNAQLMRHALSLGFAE